MAQKSYLQFIIPLLVALVAAACSKTNDCLSDFEQENFQKAISTCQRDYASSGSLSSATSWIESLGQQAEYTDIPKALSHIDDKVHRARATMIAAKFELRRSNLDAAEKYYQASVDTFRQTNMQSELAKSLHQLYFIAWQRSEHRKAISFASESLAAAQQSGQEADEIVALNDLFTIFQEVGNLGPAQQALDLVTKKLANDQTSPRRINALIGQGLLDMDRKQFGLASHSFEGALELAKNSKNKNALRGLHLNIVESNLALKRMEKAKLHLDRAWRYARPDGSQRYALLFYQSQYYFLSGDYRQSYDALIEAIESESLPGVWSWRLYYWAGQAARKLNDHQNAVAYYTRAIASSESLRKEMALSELKTNSIARRRQPYEALFIEHFAAGDFIQAFTIAEKAKNRSFTDSFIESSESAITANAQLLSFEAASDRLQSLQRYLSATLTIAINDSNTVLAALSSKHIVSFFVAERRLFVLIAVDDSLDIVEVDVNFEELTNLVQSHRQKPDDNLILRTLGELLFPAAALPTAGKHLYVSPDALFANISMP